MKILNLLGVLVTIVLGGIGIYQAIKPKGTTVSPDGTTEQEVLDPNGIVVGYRYTSPSGNEFVSRRRVEFGTENNQSTWDESGERIQTRSDGYRARGGSGGGYIP